MTPRKQFALRAVHLATCRVEWREHAAACARAVFDFCLDLQLIKWAGEIHLSAQLAEAGGLCHVFHKTP